MSSLAQAVVTLGIILTVLLAAVLIGEAIYHWGGRALRSKRFGRGSHFKGGGAFELGEQEVSEGVEALIEDIGSIPVMKCLRRHHSGDWGEIDDVNQRLNRVSLEEGGSLGFESAYPMEGGTMLRIMTFEDCSVTLLLTDKEYRQAIQERPLYVRALSECLVEQDLPKEH